MGIGSYKEAERYRMRTNKNLTRTFYLDTRRTLDEEPFAWEQPQDAGIMQPGADGSRVGFASGGIVGDKEKLIKLIEDSNKGFKVDLFKDLALKAGYAPNRREASISLPVKLDTSKDKVTKAFEYISSDLNKPVEEFVDLPKKISDLTGVKGTYVSTLLQDNENFKNLKPALTYLASPASRAKVIGTDRLFSDIVDMYEQTPNKERVIGYASPEKKIMMYADRHYLLGGNKIKFTKPISQYGFADAEFIYKGKKYNLDKLKYDGRKDKNFKEFYNIYDEKEKLLRKEVIHPITKEKVPFNELMQEVYEKGAGYKKTDIYDIDHIKGIEKDPFNNLRILTARTNQAAGALRNLESQAEKGVLKNTAQYYSPENVSKQLNKIGYNYTKDINKLAEDEVKLAEDVLLKERKLRTPQAIAKENLLSSEEKRAINLLNNQFNSGLDPATINQIYSKEIGIVKNAINKIPAPIKAVGKVFGLADVALDAIFALPYLATGDIEGAKRATTAGLFGWGKSVDEELLEVTKNKDSVQRALNNLKLVPELRQLTEEKKLLEKNLANPLDEEQASIYFENLNSVNERIKNIQDKLGKDEYTEEDQKNLLDAANAWAASKVKKTEEMFGPELKQVQGPTTQQRLFERILEEGGLSEYIPSQAIEKARGKVIPFEIPEIQSPDDSMREGFKKGGISRRDLLALLTGAAVAPELIKAVKGTKKAAQTVRAASKINFEKAEGMYSWFPDLVEKIKTKGKPFEEKELIMEASYKHEAKGYGGLPKGVETVTRHVDGDTEFLLREYPDGRIAVDIHSPRNQEGLDTPVTLYYRPTMELKYYSGSKVEPAEFKVLEKEPRYFANGPDDVDIEMSEMKKVPGKNTIYGDVEAAERFATGKIENKKIIPVKQARRDQMMDQPVDFIEETSPYGDYPY
jgi:hypothetical protein